MALQAVQGIYVPMPRLGMGSFQADIAVLLDAAAEKAALFFRVPKTGNLSKVGFLTGAVTTGDTMKVSFQDVDVNGNPDGTADQFRTVVIADTDDNTWIATGIISSDGTDGGVKRAVTKGDKVCVVIEFNSWVAGNLNLLTGSAGSSGQNMGGLSYPLRFTTAWTKLLGPIRLAVEYDDGTCPYIAGTLAATVAGSGQPAQRYVSGSMNTGTTPDEVALRLKFPFKCAVDAIWAMTDGNGPYDFIIYSAADAVLGSVSVAEKEHQFIGNPRTGEVVLSANVTLEKDTVYRIAAKPTSLTNQRWYYYTVNAAKYMEALVGSLELYESTRIDGGAWTDNTLKVPLIGVRIASLDDAVGGGGGGKAAIVSG